MNDPIRMTALFKQARALSAQFGQWGREAPRDLLGGQVEGGLQRHVGQFRDRMFPPPVTLQLFVQPVLDGDGAYVDAVARAPVAGMDRGVAVAGRATARASGALGVALAGPLKGCDGTPLSMADTPENQRMDPPAMQKRGLGFPLARRVGLVSLSKGAVLGFSLGPYQGKKTREMALLRQLSRGLHAGNVLLADGYYYSYSALAMLAEPGQQF